LFSFGDAAKIFAERFSQVFFIILY
jgi:hypothetical protein